MALQEGGSVAIGVGGDCRYVDMLLQAGMFLAERLYFVRALPECNKK
jgi:hypothetical protein